MANIDKRQRVIRARERIAAAKEKLNAEERNSQKVCKDLGTGHFLVEVDGEQKVLEVDSYRGGFGGETFRTYLKSVQ